MNEFEDDVQQCVKAIREQGVILCPTDTIWGLGCGAMDETAIEKIIKIKSRDVTKSFILLMTDVKQLSKFIANPQPDLQDLLDSYIEPTTFIYPNAINLPEQLIAHDGSIAVRITKDPFCRSIIKRIRQPLVSTSANLSGMPSPQNFYDVNSEIKSQVDYVVQWRQYENSIKNPSSIIKMNEDGSLTRIR